MLRETSEFLGRFILGELPVHWVYVGNSDGFILDSLGQWLPVVAAVSGTPRELIKMEMPRPHPQTC